MGDRDRCFGPELVVFSGGTAFNSVVKQLSATLSTRICYILPVSDSGGSTREIIRVLGGPAIGDIRSRLVRLADGFDGHYDATRQVLEHRLTTESTEAAEREFLSILSGEHTIWKGSEENAGNGPDEHEDVDKNSRSIEFGIRRQTLIAFLNHFHKACQAARGCICECACIRCSISSRATAHVAVRDGTEACKVMDYRGGSIGNFVLTGARLFFNSLSAAIHWFSTLAGLPPSTCVIPVIDVNERMTISAQLHDDSVIIGQDDISHPPGDIAGTDSSKTSTGHEPLNSAIKRIFYSDNNGLEIFPNVNKSVLLGLKKAHAVVSVSYYSLRCVIVVICADLQIYGMGSLYTSILPSLIVGGVGRHICALSSRKVLILNGSRDRETSIMNAIDIVTAIVRGLCQSFGGNEGRIPVEINENGLISVISSLLTSGADVGAVQSSRNLCSSLWSLHQVFYNNTNEAEFVADKMLGMAVTDIFYLQVTKSVSREYEFMSNDCRAVLQGFGVNLHEIDRENDTSFILSRYDNSSLIDRIRLVCDGP
jgi:2-phospho-L-lactate transferase/gluconeogenesis factor (CofD/UPF0052 family)